ncbi:MAG: homoserine kinase [Thermotogae bacterium]|nr:MAG: homoserine kinase [Thermotogota bacterium]
MERLKIRVPASCANLGSAFDVLGVAVSLDNVFEFIIAERDTFICEGKFCGLINPEDVFRTLNSLCKTLSVERPPLIIKESVKIPLGAGLGSSASFVVASVIALNELLELRLSKDELLKLGAAIEGHPDNIAPSLLGGCVLVKQEESVYWRRLPWPRHWKITVYVPSSSMSTEEARRILPMGYSRETVVKQIASVGFLIYGVLHEDLQAFKYGMEDYIHQQYRLLIKPELKRVFETLKASINGAIFLSGSGPTIGVVCEMDEEPPNVAGTIKFSLKAAHGAQILVN